MNPENTNPANGQDGSMPQPAADPYRPTNYAWQRGFGRQTPDNRIIPQPDPRTMQPIQPARQEPTMPEQSPILGQPAPQLPPVVRFQPPPVAPMPPPNSVEPAPPPAPRPKRRRWPIVLIIVLLVAALSVAVYFFVLKPSDKKETGKPATSSKTSQPVGGVLKEVTPPPASEQTVSLATLAMAKLNAPANMSGYTLLASADNFARYTVEGKGTCELGFGTLASDALRGDTLDAIIDAQVKALQGSGATVKGPSAGTTLELTDATSSAKKYSLQTLQFEIAKDNVRAKSHYSAIVLTGGKRAVINRTCYTEDISEVSDSDMAALDATAKRITITPQ